MNPGFPPQFIPAKAGAGMTTFYEAVNDEEWTGSFTQEVFSIGMTSLPL